MDPLTIAAMASSAFKAVQGAINAGREIEDMGATLGKWAGAFSDIKFLEEKHKNPPFYKTFSGTDEAKAIELFAAKKKIENQKRELETLIGYSYGPRGLDEYKRTLRMIKEQREQREHRRQEMKEAAIEFAVGTIVVLGLIIVVSATVWAIGKHQGKW